MIFCNTKYHRCYFKKILKYIVFFFFYQFQTITNPLYHFVFVFTHRNDMKLTISQWNWWKLRLCFGKTIWNWVFLSETGGKSRLLFRKMIWNRVFPSETGGKLRLCFGKMIWNQSISQWNWWKIEIMFWENRMKPSIQYQKNLDLWPFSFEF